MYQDNDVSGTEVETGGRRNVPESFELGCGAGSRNRTHDQRFTKPLLYQLSYAGPLARCVITRLFYSLARSGH